MEWLFLALIVLLIAGAIILRVNRSKINGKLGEKRVDSVLKRVRGEYGEVISDYMMRGERISVQIDHIMMNEYGVFVIETKNYSGRIYGGETDDEWLQVLAYGKVKNKFRSPLKQNAGHIYNLRKLIPDAPIFGLVVFVQNNVQNIKADGVVGLNCLKREIARLSVTAVLTPADIKRICTVLENNRDMQTGNKRHVKEIREMVAGVESNRICPRCGGSLVMRESKYGKFIGCQNYPKCKFTKDI